MKLTDHLRNRIIITLRLLVLAAAAVLVLVLSRDTFLNMSFVADPFYLRLQKWICYFFLFDIVVEWSLSPRKLHYLLSNVVFILISIPYMSIVQHFHWELPGPVVFLLRFMPILRAAFVLGMLVGALSRKRMTTLFATYMTILVSTLYFGSVMFFIAEQPVNPGVHTFWSALWWAIMDMTTCGSSISELTPTGQVLGVVLAAEGLILFPVFTVYITSALTPTQRQAAA